ncbi:uncharacterized protein LAESUDRAFT_739975 [Laetiporus sulphureus 93-53]|uniref:RBR-type E3 ubiquitin transferase n=1 Tax=Laetiporus sulphureus 93-53 TaxID=1314785 RepID=A0A165I552_9APHY|nr:uncharacterized protein LAESUDRAFT_739975 [Laetiporus sulphureus 93-53]KZT12603.1 hypothetical protein LAESUDRAFT_739975 [Laetiporus sulphureus 93-53]
MARGDVVKTPDVPEMIMAGSMGEVVVSHAGRSQYSRIGGGVSACGLAALNCARVILDMERTGLRNENIIREIMKRETLEEVLRPCLSWSRPAHLDVEEIYKAPVFNKSLKLVMFAYEHSGLGEFTQILSHLSNHTRDTRSSTCAIITRPPEIVACVKLATNKSDVFVIFDSHPRPQKHPNGAAFIFQPSVVAAASYLAELFSYDDRLLMDSSVQWQAQLLAHFSAHIFTARDTMGTTAELAEAVLEASLEVLNLRARVLELESHAGDLEVENTQLSEDVTRLEDDIMELKAKNLRNDSRLRKSEGAANGELIPPAAHCTNNLSSISEKVRGKMPAIPTERASQSSPRSYGLNDRSAKPWNGGSRQASSRTGLNCSSSDEPMDMDDFTVAAILLTQADQLKDADAMYAAEQQRKFDEEDHYLKRQMHDLKYTALDVFECGICFDQFNRDVVAEVEPCGHRFCRECARNYAVSKVEGHRYPIPCPLCMGDKARKDPGAIDDSLIQQLGLSEKQYAIFVEMQMAAFSIILHCRKCENSVFVDKQEYEAAKILVCPLQGCNYAWCKACSQKIEIGGPQHSCDGSAELKHLMDQKGWKYCPGCQTPAEKIDGCNHMTCMSPGCNTHFCYGCGEAITQSIRRQEIHSDLSAHYRRCRLFDYT